MLSHIDPSPRLHGPGNDGALGAPIKVSADHNGLVVTARSHGKRDCDGAIHLLVMKGVNIAS